MVKERKSIKFLEEEYGLNRTPCVAWRFRVDRSLR